MDRKADRANQDCQEYRVHLVFMVTWEIQVLKEKRGPCLLDPQACLGHLEWMGRKDSQGSLHLVTQDPLEIGVFKECQG